MPNTKPKPVEIWRALLQRHFIEILLIIAALVTAILFVVLHLVFNESFDLWWLLAISTIFLAISDVILRIKL